MKIAISGKGGVGKSTISAILAQLLVEKGQKVLAVDADPDANLASALGISKEDQKTIIPIAKQRKLIEERTGAKVRQFGQIFKLNPEVSDIAEHYAFNHNGVALLVVGSIEQGGSGCACPENVLIKSLLTDLILFKNESLVMDMEAGIEHLGRATTKGVDTLIIVVEPGQRSIDSAQRIISMSKDIGLSDIKFIANKVDGFDDELFIKKALSDSDILAFIPFSPDIKKADRQGKAVFENLSDEQKGIFGKILAKLAVKQD